MMMPVLAFITAFYSIYTGYFYCKTAFPFIHFTVIIWDVLYAVLSHIFLLKWFKFWKEFELGPMRGHLDIVYMNTAWKLFKILFVCLIVIFRLKKSLFNFRSKNVCRKTPERSEFTWSNCLTCEKTYKKLRSKKVNITTKNICFLL